MIRLTRPSDGEIVDHLAAADGELTYAEVGATLPIEAPIARARLSGYDVDHHRVVLGEGAVCFERATRALACWRHFDVPWVGLHGAESHVEPGQIVGVRVRVAGLWMVNPCRVLSVDLACSDEHSAWFNYGTLAGHAERGEERFVVRFDDASGRVEYEIAAFSRPALWLTRLGYPLARLMQRRFARGSALAMLRAVDGISGPARSAA